MQINKVTRYCLSSPKKPGGNVIDLNDEQYEDIVLGNLMDKVKTNETINKELIMNQRSGLSIHF